MKLPLSQRSFYPWMVVGLLWFVAFLNYMDRQMLSTMQTHMMADIAELNVAANFGRLMAIFLWIYGLMSPLSGIIADRISRKWLIVGSLSVWSSVTFLMGYADSFGQLYFLRGIMGVSEALYLPAALSLIADYHIRTRSLAVGVHMTGLYLGQAIGGFGAIFATLITWQATFHFFGMVGVGYAALLALLLRDKPRGITHPAADPPTGKNKIMVFKSLSILFTNISFWIILFYFCIPGIPGWATKNWLPTLFSQTLGVDMTVAGPIATISIAASSLAGVLFGGWLSDRWILTNLRGRVYTGAIGVALLIPALMFIGFGSTLFSCLMGAALFGIGFGMFDANNMPILCQFVSSRLRGTAYGFMNMCGVFAGAAITGILGRSADAGKLGLDFALLAVLVLVMVAVQLLFLRPRHVDMPDEF